jgi:hypothetical protein
MSSSPFALRVSLIADLIKLVTETPGISTGTETKGIPLCALFLQELIHEDLLLLNDFTVSYFIGFISCDD